MAREFSANDKIDFGSDTSIDDFTSRTGLMWIRPDTVGAGGDKATLLDKSDGVLLNPTGTQFGIRRNAAGEANCHLHVIQNFGITDGEWNSPTNGVTFGALQHVAYVYDRSAVGNDPTFYINSGTVATTEIGVPAGGSQGDAAESLLTGEEANGSGDYDGAVGWIIYDNSIFTAAQINRCRWYGEPGGPVEVYQPLWTDSLTNKGTATANGTATGTTMGALPRVERMWGSMMGVGR